MRIMGAHRIDRPGQHVVVLRFNGDNENWEEFLGKLGFRANYSFTMRVLRWRVGPLVYCIEKGDCLDIEELGDGKYSFRIIGTKFFEGVFKVDWEKIGALDPEDYFARKIEATGL